MNSSKLRLTKRTLFSATHTQLIGQNDSIFHASRVRIPRRVSRGWPLVSASEGYDYLAVLAKIDRIEASSICLGLAMKTVTFGKVQANFGEIAGTIDVTKSGEVVTVTQYGRSTLLPMRYQDAIRSAAGKKAVAWLDERAKNLPEAAQELTQ